MNYYSNIYFIKKKRINYKSIFLTDSLNKDSL